MDLEQAETPTLNTTGTQSGASLPFYRRISFWALVTLLAVCFLQGFRYQLAPGEEAENQIVLYNLAGCLLIFVWCFFDAKERGIYIPHSFQWLILIFAVVAGPIYYLWSRGWKWAPLLVCFVAILYGSIYAGAYTGWWLILFL